MSAFVSIATGMSAGAVEPARETVRVTSPARLLEAPAESASRIAILPAAFAAQWLGCAEGWVHIAARMGGKQVEGYVRADRTDWPHRC